MTRSQPGRPRRADVERLVDETSLRLLADHGYSALTLEAVAREAGVSRPTLYRRWTSKAALVVDVISRAAPPITRYDSGSLLDDIERTYQDLFAGFNASALAPALLVLVGEAQHDRELNEALRANYLAPREQEVLALLDEGIRTGRLRAGLPVQAMHQMIMGSLFFRQIALGEPVHHTTNHDIFTALWHGLAHRDFGDHSIMEKPDNT